MNFADDDMPIITFLDTVRSTRILVDLNDDGVANMRIDLLGNASVALSDFLF